MVLLRTMTIVLHLYRFRCFTLLPSLVQVFFHAWSHSDYRENMLDFWMPQMYSRQVEEGKIQRKNRLERGLTSNEWCREADTVWNIIKSKLNRIYSMNLDVFGPCAFFGTVSILIGQNQSQRRRSHYNSSV